MNAITNVNMTRTNSNKKQRSKEEWQELVRRLRASGLSISRFCKQNHIGKSSLYYWLNIDGASPQVNTANDTVSFAKMVTEVTADEITMESETHNTASQTNHDNIQISLPSGTSIKLPINYDARLLFNLIKGLQSC